MALVTKSDLLDELPRYMGARRPRPGISFVVYNGSKQSRLYQGSFHNAILSAKFSVFLLQVINLFLQLFYSDSLSPVEINLPGGFCICLERYGLISLECFSIR